MGESPKIYPYMQFERKQYVEELKAGQGNGLVKIVTGIRRCGKSYLLFKLWHQWLVSQGIGEDHIIEAQMDDFKNRNLRDPDVLMAFIDNKPIH